MLRQIHRIGPYRALYRTQHQAHRGFRSFTTTTQLAKQTPNSGSHGQTDDSIKIKYPSSQPSSTPTSDTTQTHSKPTLPSFSMADKTAIITGGARGLGLVMAQALMTSGANIAIVDLNESEAHKARTHLLETYHSQNPSSPPPTITAHHTDVSSESSVTSTLAAILSAHDTVDTLVTSAGFTENFAAHEYPIERIRALWAVNVDGTYLWASAVAKHLMEREAKGSMVFVGSMSGAIVNVPQPQAPYNASKAAVRHLAASLAVEWAGRGIRVNCLSPGYMATALTKKILEDKPALREKWTSLIPMGRMGNPEDLMGAVVYLASDASAYVTGAELRVDGGYTVT
ncbi:D-arabinitol 2-dehydrogenase [Microthyrium microscopicum]|uniref:NADP-dependent mannitol dehydrogenase n=1 Tax=Microthyrium microscopicum TaxID=703497 RepID=A0A6A6UR19_9PEZI|nr:D-arabinitol 2-dehydrogenase [Microthyrium microscopicum]